MARLATSGTRRAPNRPRALILAPTRELVTQIEASLAPLAKATGLRSVNIFGGVGADPQISALRGGVDIVIACPGRLEDHMRSGHADLSAVEVTVLDEADHMADLGFLPGVKRLLDRTPKTASACCSRPRSTPGSTCWSSATCTTRWCTVSTRHSHR